MPSFSESGSLEAAQEHAECDTPLPFQHADGERHNCAGFERGLEADDALCAGVELEVADAAVNGGVDEERLVVPLAGFRFLWKFFCYIISKEWRR